MQTEVGALGDMQIMRSGMSMQAHEGEADTKQHCGIRGDWHEAGLAGARLYRWKPTTEAKVSEAVHTTDAREGRQRRCPRSQAEAGPVPKVTDRGWHWQQRDAAVMQMTNLLSVFYSTHYNPKIRSRRG